MNAPKPPADLRRAGRGRKLWTVVNEKLQLDGRDALALHEACRMLDRLDSLNDVIAQDGLLLRNGRVRPAVVEARLLALAFSRFLASMRLPEDLADPVVRPQRRAGSRGFYSVKGRSNSA